MNLSRPNQLFLLRDRCVTREPPTDGEGLSGSTTFRSFVDMLSSWTQGRRSIKQKSPNEIFNRPVYRTFLSRGRVSHRLGLDPGRRGPPGGTRGPQFVGPGDARPRGRKSCRGPLSCHESPWLPDRHDQHFWSAVSNTVRVGSTSPPFLNDDAGKPDGLFTQDHGGRGKIEGTSRLSRRPCSPDPYRVWKCPVRGEETRPRSRPVDNK